MFMDNKYKRWYFDIMQNAQNRKTPTVYTETHHIIPKSLGGTDDYDNLVCLTAKEHYVVHHLLTKMTSTLIERGKMWNAFFLMHAKGKGQDRYYTARSYSYAKEQMAEYKRCSMLGENNHYYGKTHSDKTKQKMSDSWNRTTKRNHDMTQYTFFHNDHGVITCTRRELCETYNLNQKRIWGIVNKTQKTALGWSVVWEKDQIL